MTTASGRPRPDRELCEQRDAVGGSSPRSDGDVDRPPTTTGTPSSTAEPSSWPPFRYHDDLVDTFAEIADERRGLAALVSGLTGEQQATQSLCSEWSVHDVVAHLVVPLEVSTPEFVLAVLACRGDFDLANVRLTREQARRPFGEIVEVLHRKADSRFTPPGSGPEAPLTDLLVHGLDIRWPLGLPRDIPEERLHKSLTFLTAAPGGGIVPKGTLGGLRFEATDIDWAHGSGPTVSGDAETLLLAITGRTTALGHLSGDGVSTLRGRLA